MATRLMARFVPSGAASLSVAATASGVGAASVAVGHPRKRTVSGSRLGLGLRTPLTRHCD